MNTAGITNFTTRFAAWQEYRIVRAKISFRPFSSTTPGILRMWVEEKAISTPTLSDALAAGGISANLSANNREFVMIWKPSDLGDEGWISLSTANGFAYLNIYTDTANYGAPTAVTAVGQVLVEFTFQFRGFA